MGDAAAEIEEAVDRQEEPIATGAVQDDQNSFDDSSPDPPEFSAEPQLNSVEEPQDAAH
jgi:hypothetical protein